MKALSLEMPGLAVPRHWRAPLICLVLLLGALLWLLRETGIAMVHIWDRSGDFTHAWVVPPIAGWLVWRLRARLAVLQPRPAPAMVLPMAALTLMWWLSDRLAMNSGTQLALMGLLVTSVPLLLGLQVSRVILFPLCFLFFAVPVGDFMTPYLMHWTADAVVAGLRWTGIPVYREGQQLAIPSGRWAVVEACGGIRYLMSTLMVGSLFAYLNYRSALKRTVFMGLALVVPILANWARAYIIVMLGHLSNNEIATGVDHLLYGWVFFGIVIFTLFMIGSRWAEPEPSFAADRPMPVLAPAQQRRRDTGVAACALVALLATAWPHLLPSVSAGMPGPQPVIRLPQQLGTWRVAEVPTLDWTPMYEGARTTVNQAYRGPAGEVVVNLQYYRDQDYASKLVSSTNILVESGGRVWNRIAEGRVHGAGARPVEWNTAHVVLSDGARMPGGARAGFVVWQLYWVGGHLTTRQVEAKLWQAWLALTGQPDDAAAIILHAPAASQTEGDARLQSFVAENLATIERSLEQARDTR
ncbi:MAG: hypothetical protein RIQ53_4651 [Pseudomonadota bacterium]